MARTEDEMKEILKDRLYPGKAVKVENWAMLKDGTFRYKSNRKGVIAGLYPHIFTVRFGDFLESFRYSQFFEKGNERVKL